MHRPHANQVKMSAAVSGWIDIGEDDDGYTISRPATVDEEHAAWVAERSPWDARAQAADDRWSDRGAS